MLELLKAELANSGSTGNGCALICSRTRTATIPGEPRLLRLATGAKVYAGEGDVAVLAKGGPREAVFSTFYMPEYAPHPTSVDVALKGGETIALGDVLHPRRSPRRATRRGACAT